MRLKIKADINFIKIFRIRLIIVVYNKVLSVIKYIINIKIVGKIIFHPKFINLSYRNRG